MSGSSFASFLRQSLTALERERPDVATHLAAALARLDVAIEVDDERLGLRSDGRSVHVGAWSMPARVVVRTTRGAILALVDGEQSLVDAVLCDALLLTGPPADLARFHDALWLYLQGAVRAASFPTLLEAYRRAGASGMPPR